MIDEDKTMWEWIKANIANIIIVIILLATVGIALAVMIRNRKKGKSCCGGSCCNCAMSGSCGSRKRDGKDN